MVARSGDQRPVRERGAGAEIALEGEHRGQGGQEVGADPAGVGWLHAAVTHVGEGFQDQGGLRSVPRTMDDVPTDACAACDALDGEGPVPTFPWSMLDEVEDLTVPTASPESSTTTWCSFELGRLLTLGTAGILEWILLSKRPTTRQDRVRGTAEKAARGERINQRSRRRDDSW